MQSYYALLSIVYMIVFVALFDKFHLNRFISRFCSKNLLRPDEMSQIMRLLSVCQED